MTSIIFRIPDLLLETRLFSYVNWKYKRLVVLPSVYTVIQREQGGENHDSSLPENLTSRIFAILFLQLLWMNSFAD